MTRWFVQKVAYAATRFGFIAGCLAIRIFPRECIFRLSDALANLAFLLFRSFRVRSIKNVSIAFGNSFGGASGREIVRHSLRNFFRACVEAGVTLESSGEELRSTIPIYGREYLDAALAKGDGVILLSAHLGNFFLIGTRLAIEGYPVHVLVNQPRDGQFAKLMDDYRLQVKQRTIHARPRRQALKELYVVLKRNELAMVIADEYRKGNGLCVPLFGRAVLARRGPATLALRTGAAVVPVYMIRQPDNSLKLIIEPELELVRSGNGAEKIRENTLRMTQWLEKTVRAYPDQWNWMNIRWWETDENQLLTAPDHQSKVSFSDEDTTLQSPKTFVVPSECEGSKRDFSVRSK
jgi:KDO2-lipid IV(A) lauroyltransferase